MRTPLLSLCLAAVPLLGQAAAPCAWGPAVYTLRATEKTGSALVLLDAQGRETVIDRDDRTESGGGFMSSVLFHATFYGAFTATPDLKTVVFTKHGKVKAPFTIGFGGFSGGSGGGIGYSAAFGEHDLEGIYAWDSTTGKIQKLWDQDSLISQLKTWIKSPEGAAFSDVDLKDEVRAHRPATLFHLDGSRFAWVNGATVFELDIAARSARILFSDLDKGRVVAGGHAARSIAVGSASPGGAGPSPFQGSRVTLAFSQKPALSTAFQNGDGSLVITRPGMVVRIPLTGAVQVTPLGEGHRLVWNGPEIVTFTNGDLLRTVDLKTAKSTDPAAGAKLESSMLQPCADGRSTFIYKHYKTREDTLARVDPAGKVLWTANLGDCRFGFLLAEDGDKVNVLVRRTSGDLPMRMVLKADSGSLVTQSLWLSSEGVEKTYGGPPAPVDLADRAVMLPCPSGFLVWAPSRGEVEGAPAGAWSRDAVALPETADEKASDGQWCLLTPQLVLKPIARRPLADQMLVLAQGRMEPVMNWINHGISQSSNPGDRVLTSLNKKPLPFFIRDFGFWAPPTLSGFAAQVSTGHPEPPATRP